MDMDVDKVATKVYITTLVEAVPQLVICLRLRVDHRRVQHDDPYDDDVR